MKNIIFNYLFFFASSIFLFFSIYLLALPIWLDISLFLLIILFFKNKFQIFITAFLISIMILIFITFFPQINNDELYYRPHDKFFRDKSYEKNINYTMSANHGDLYPMALISNKNIADIKEKKILQFITDQYGYRNDNYKINNSEIILVGDSFIVGNGNSQNDIPANQLSRISGLSVASIAFPGTPHLYEEIANNFIDDLKSNAKIIIYYFEGNDFFENKNLNIPFKIFLRKEYYNIELKKDRILNKIYINKKSILREIRKKSHLINKKLIYVDEISSVMVEKIGRKNVVFFKEYSSRQDRAYIIKNKKILKKLIGVFFIPTKARTYSNYLSDNFNYDSLQFLKNKYNDLNIPVVDLSKVFIKNSSILLKKDKYLYWRDDSHWNPIGIEIAMKCVNNFIQTDIKDRMNFKCK